MTNLLNLNGYLYILTKNDLKYFDHVNKKVFNVTGFGNHSDVMRAKEMKNPESAIQEFYVIGTNRMTIYELTSPTTVKVSLEIDDLGFEGTHPVGNIHYHPYFYLSGYQKIVVVDLSVRSSPKLSMLPMNGSCF